MPVFVKMIAVILLIPVLALFTAGCWGKTELNEIGIVTTIGIDAEPDGSLRMTVLSEQPEGSPTAPPPRSITWIGTATGANLTEASKNLRKIAVKKLTWIHNSIVIIGQEAAKTKMNEVVDFLSRNREIRFNSHILVAEGKAFDLLQAPADVQRDLYVELEGLVKNLENWPKSYSADLKELLVSNAEQCGDLVTSRIWYTEEQRNTFSTAREDFEKLYLNGRKLPIMYLEGSAVFRQGKFAGWLDAEETRGYLWIRDKIRPGAIVAHGNGGTVAMENIYSNTSVKIKNENGNFSAQIKVVTHGTLMEQTSDEAIQKPSAIRELEHKFADVIKAQMQRAVNKAQKEYNTDIFRFSNMINRRYPQEWRHMKNEWENGIFAGMKVEYEVNVTLERTGKVLRTIMEGG